MAAAARERAAVPEENGDGVGPKAMMVVLVRPRVAVPEENDGGRS